MKEATPDQIERWDELVAANPDGGNVLQSRAFGQVKGAHGWKDRYFMLGGTAVLVLERVVPAFGKIWYVPKGPGVGDRGGLKAFVEQIPDKPFLVKIDPEIPKDAIKPESLTKLGLQPARNVQYNVSTVVVRLDGEEEAIIGGFKQKTRYNVRLAAKKGVEAAAVDTDGAAIDQMYFLMQETAKRAGVFLRDKQYFADFWRLHAEQGTGQMFFAKYEGKVLAGAFVTYLGTKALYKDGGSVREHSDVQAPYALQWGIMQWLKQHGVTEYDLHGVPPADQIDNPKHPLAGLARFKLGFNAEVTEFIGTYDLALDKAKYQLWNRVGEKLVMRYEHRVKSRLFY